MPATIVAALRVKNEARWIAEVLGALSWCDKTYLFDDSSTDDTGSIALACGATVLASPFKDFDEARDKEYITRQIAREYPESAYVLMLDGDEVLEPEGERLIREDIDLHPAGPCWTLPVVYLWNSRDQWRTDGVYGHFTRPSLFRLGTQHSFRLTANAGHMHCSSVPAAYLGRGVAGRARLLHLGYMDKADRIRKWKYYNGIDGKNRTEGFDPLHPERGAYPHIVQGDVPEVPADARLMYSGPLTLRPL